MTAKNNQKDNKEMKPGTREDNQVILDDRGFYKVGNWWARIRRINVREIIAGWGVISQAFTQVQGLDFNWKDVSTWVMLFLVALPTVPGKFYMFLQQVMELQNSSDLTDEEFFKKESQKYTDYIRKDLTTEELIDVINIIYNQEKERFSDLAKQVDFILQPLINMMMAEKKQQAADQAEKLLKAAGITGPKLST